MVRIPKLLSSARENPSGLSFAELKRLVESSGFELDRINHKLGAPADFRHDANLLASNAQIIELVVVVAFLEAFRLQGTLDLSSVCLRHQRSLDWPKSGE